jgi:predicted nucleic-acid-binding protein
MSARRFIDTNLVVRYLVKDNEKQAATAGRLFEACDRGDLMIVLLPAVLAECVFVLESFYKRERNDIAVALRTLISSPGIEMEGTITHLDALERYRNTRVHFVDCVIAATAAAKNVAVATFDRDFGKFTDVHVKTD